ncbi:LOW QUALITY PROTEIN: serine/threonine-protein kinase VPS15 [Neltuma alba]|uniref:LOW QUALITY PROTEIN: serine/threonine-protein kinase VPS15 n=1 Tax=Neltuma alba TaxID=207710 RepID=UPI0010A3046E|nr:LOW QUALITY PROTEIN: serine/threonine-protein kinase VPS15 [Prosopis alba]
MGNKIARTTQVSASEYYLHDLPSTYNLVLKEVLGRGRFFKSIQCKHDEGLVLVKVYFKRGDFIDLREYERRLSQIRDIFRGIEHPHVWPFQFWQETDKAAYLLRQYFFHNLHDRLSTRPFLSLIEKKWLSFQLLLAVKQSHEKGVCHGDIKCENVLITSWSWLYLADFASFKPTYIPYDDPSDFSFFFDTGGRRLCYLAPERFYEHGGEMQVVQDASLKPSMDIFAVGCVIAELFLEGQPLFELSQLLAYRRGQYDPSQHLEKIPDPGVRKMILHMIQLEPESRFSAESYLKEYAAVVFPTYFSPFLHDFYRCWSPLHSDMKVLLCQSAFQEILKQMMNSKSSDEVAVTSGELLGEVVGKENVNFMKDSLMKRDEMGNGLIPDHYELLGDISSLLRGAKNHNHLSGPRHVIGNAPNSILCENLKNLQSPGELLQIISNAFRGNDHPFLKNVTMNDLNSLMSDYDSQSDTFGMPFLPLPKDSMRCEGMVLITSLLCSCVRNIKLPHLRRAAVLLLKASALYTDDEDRLQRVIPYVIGMLSDPSAIVRCAALETLCDILPLVRDFPPSDAKIFPEYIFPMLSMLPDDPEESVRICYASNIAKLALTAYGFLIHSISLSEAGVLDELSSPQKSLVSSSQTSGRLCRINGDVQLLQLRKSVADVVQELVMGPKQTPNIRRALLQDIGKLCYFFGQRHSNDFLLPILPAFLNDRDEQLRSVFYEKIVYVCFFVGQRSVEEYLLPYIEQALSDTTEAVMVRALDCLTSLCKSVFFRKRILLEMIERAFPLLCYPSKWVRRSVVSFIAASSESLGAVDSYVYLAPVIRPFLRRQPVSLASVKALFSCLKPPVSRQVFHEVLENSRSSDMLERQRKIWYSSSSQSRLWEMDLLRKGIDELDSLNSWPDKQQGPGGQQSVGTGFPQPGLTDCDQADTKLRNMVTFMHNDCIVSPRTEPPVSRQVFHEVLENSRSSDMLERQRKIWYSSSSQSRLWEMDLLRKGIDELDSLNSWPDKQQGPGGQQSVGTGFPQPGLTDCDQADTKLRNMVTFMHNDCSMIGHRDPQCLEKLQFSGLMSPQVSCSSLPYEKSSNGIPLYSFSVDRRAMGIPPAASDSPLQMNSLGISSSTMPWVSPASKSFNLASSVPAPKFVSVFIDHISRGLGNVVEKYSGVADITKKDIKEGAILNLLNYPVDAYTIMFSTQNCGIHLWDTRSSSSSWTQKVTPEEGYIPSLVVGPCGNWFVSGSSRGVLTLWDLRFLIPVNSWQYSLACPIEKMCLFLPPPNASLSSTVRPLVYVAAGSNEISLWNAENGSCHQVLKVTNYDSDAEKSELPWALARPSNKGTSRPDLRRNVNPKYRVDELNEPPPRLPGIRTLLPLPGGDLLTGGTDLRIRRWDHYSPDKSYCICGPDLKGVGNDDLYETKSSFGVQIVQETKRRPLSTKLTAKAVVTAAATDPAGCHRDSILSLASVKLNQRLLLSSSRDGAIKVWK